MNVSQLFPPELHLIGTFGDLVIATRPAPDVAPGHQHIYITQAPDHTLSTPTLLAHDLAMVLGLHDYTWADVAGARWLVVPHTPTVDARLKALVDLAHALRMAAPGLVQLSFAIPGTAL
ncbi:MAG: hypothetical protein IT318_24670 [Anaerolineales bacterium]|nr:hypothetical protein [Anaerolineales bacterium]